MSTLMRRLWVVSFVLTLPLWSITWSAPPLDLSAIGRDADTPQVAIDPAGNAVAVWNRSDGSNTIIQAATLPFGAAMWTTYPDLSAAGQNAINPQVGVDAMGNAVAVWQRSDGSNKIIQSSRLPFGAVMWIAQPDLSGSGQDATDPQIAVDPAGNSVVVWQRSNGANTIIQSVTKAFAAAMWSLTTNLSMVGQNGTAPQVAVDPMGNAVAVWTQSIGVTIVQAASKPFGMAWSAASNLSAAGQFANAPRVGVSATGYAVVVWERSNGMFDIIQSATAPFGGAWSMPIDASLTGINCDLPKVAVDPAGNSVATWFYFNGSGFVVQASTLPFGGMWTTPIDLSDAMTTSSSLPSVGVDAAGDAVVTWNAFSMNAIIQGRTLPFGTGTWTSALDISLPGGNAFLSQVAVTALGETVVVWRRNNGTNNIIQSSTTNIYAAPPVPPTPTSGGGSRVFKRQIGPR